MSATASSRVLSSGQPPLNLVLDVKQTAVALRVSVPTVRRFIKRKEIPVVRLGRRVVVMPADIVAFLKKRREK